MVPDKPSARASKSSTSRVAHKARSDTIADSAEPNRLSDERRISRISRASITFKTLQEEHCGKPAPADVVGDVPFGPRNPHGR
jgi:hypothetical protein